MPAIWRLLAQLEAALGVPVVPMESPRGINDPRLGAFAEVLRQADLIVLLGKALDFTLRFGRSAVRRCRLPVHRRRSGGRADRARAAREGRAPRLQRRRRCQARRRRADRTRAQPRRAGLGWAGEVRAAIAYRPPAWATLRRARAGQAAPRRAVPRAAADPRPRIPTPSWSATAARSGNGRRPCSRRRAASSTAPPARSARRSRSPSRARAAAPERARDRRDGRRHLRLPHGRVRHRRALRPALRRRGRQRRRAGTPSTRSSCATTAPTARTAASCCPTRYDLVAAGARRPRRAGRRAPRTSARRWSAPSPAASPPASTS